MNPPIEPGRKVVLGLGNILNRDEGLGIQALKLLDARLGNQNAVELLDGGVLGLNLLMIVEECSHLLILDAVDARKQPGSLVELSKPEIPLYTGIKISQHQITFQEVLGLASIRGRLPEYMHLVGIQPEDTSVGLEISPSVERTLPLVVQKSMEKLFSWGIIPEDGVA